MQRSPRTRPSTHRRGRWLARTGAGVVAAALVTLTVPAWAHVSVVPGEVEGGGFTAVSFRVPTERDDASTSQVRVLLPQEQPIGSVSTRPMPGWKVTTKKRRLSEPIDLFGEKVDSVVSEVTWTATGAGIAPGQYDDFDVSLGPLPKSGQLAFTAIQTYDSGEVVKWNEVAVDDSVEPEHPAPVLTIAKSAAPVAAGDERDERDEQGTLLPLLLSGSALAVAVISLLLTLRLTLRRRA